MNSIFSKDAKSLINWPIENKKIIVSITLSSTAMFVISNNLLNLNYPTSITLTGITFAFTIIDQKYPHIKNEIFNKVTQISKILYDQCAKPVKAIAAHQRASEEKSRQENVQLMLSYLGLSFNQISQIYKREKELDFGDYKPFIYTCNTFGLSDTQIRTLINYYATFPNSFRASETDYNERYERFLNLLPKDQKTLFQNMVKKES